MIKTIYLSSTNPKSVQRAKELVMASLDHIERSNDMLMHRDAILVTFPSTQDVVYKVDASDPRNATILEVIN